MGEGIIMGNHYGEGDQATLKRKISTTMLAGVAFSLTVSLVTIPLAGQILIILRANEAIMEISTVYLRIILTGVVFTFLYNFFSNTLRALGDSTTPLYFLIASAVLNIIGDLFFVIVLRLGVSGCGIATVISEGLCCLFCYVYIRKKVPLLNLGKNWLVFDKTLLKTTVSYGWVSAMQQATVQLGKMGVQVVVNTMDLAATAAFTAVNRIDDFTYTPQQNIAHAMTSFMAQNRGAGKNDRVRAGFKAGMKIELVYGIFVFLICFLFAKPLISLFSTEEDVIEEGLKYLRLIAFMYILPALTNGIQGYFRGIGDLKITLVSSFINMFTRVLVCCILVFAAKMGIEALPYGYLAGWAAMLAAETPLLVKSLLKRNERAE